MSTRRRVAALVAAAAALSTVPLVTQRATASPTYEATISRTAYGIPHIVAEDYGGLGFGYGYAFATDNLCTAADFYVTVNGERSKWFGPTERWSFRGNGTNNTNLESDFFYKSVNESGVIERLLAGGHPAQAQTPIPEDLREGVRGYVAGYNAFLADYRDAAATDTDADADGILDESGLAILPCADEPWVRPILEIDAYRRFFQLASLASAAVAVNEIGGAQPPHPSVGDVVPSPTAEELAAQAVDELPTRFSEALGIGSNAYGLGTDATTNGKGLVLGNPHFPWHEGERLYQSHLTVRTDDGDTLLDVSGASLYGVPLVLIGHTQGLAWSHTVSTAFRFTPFELTLVPGSPTTYLVDGEPREMTSRTLTVDLPGGETATRTLYETEYGPVMTGILGLPIFPWTPVKAFAMGDANVHLRYLNHFWEVNHAQSVQELYEIQRDIVGIPWVNTMAADADGGAYYGDISVVPNVTDEHAQRCNTAVGHATFAALRLPVLDGSRSDCAWATDADAPAPGIFGESNLPHLFRDDYVTNSNDSYWLSNPHEPITGYDRIIGDEGTARSLRTRLGLLMLEERRQPGGGPFTDRLDREDVTELVFNNRHYGGELAADAAADLCHTLGGVLPNTSKGVTVVDHADCDVLADWGRTDDLDDPGAVWFRRFWGRAGAAAPSPWLVPFDVNDPVNTPNTLNTALPQVIEALGSSVEDLRGAGIALGAALGDDPDGPTGPRGPIQHETRQSVARAWGSAASEPIAIHGGPGGQGVFNAISATWSPTLGYPDIVHGSSFVMVAHFVEPTEANGWCPVDASAIVTYSQSENPNSPWFADQTRLYSQKGWNDMHFCEDEIAGDLVGPPLEVSG